VDNPNSVQFLNDVSKLAQNLFDFFLVLIEVMFQFGALDVLHHDFVLVCQDLQYFRYLDPALISLF